MGYLIKLFFFFILSFMFVSCSDEGYYESSTSLYAPKVTGQFIDDVVAGLDYNCSSSISGTTDLQGNYTCVKGDDVTFYLGEANIGTVAAQSTFISPYSLFPSDIDAAVNLARLIQSLDEDGDSSNGVIVLDAALLALIPADTDFRSATFVEYIESSLNITLVSIEIALNNLNASVLEAGGEIPVGGNIPVANAGVNQTVYTKKSVILDGSGSSDADTADVLTYSWSFELKPVDSNATLVDATIVNPTFVADKSGTYVLSLVVNDGTINSAADTVTINAANVAPTATFAILSMNEDEIHSGVLSAIDPNDDNLTYSKVSDPLHGTLVVDANGTFTYTPTADYNGDDTFSYKVNDSLLDSTTQTVDVTVVSVSDTPVIILTTPITVNENQTSAFTITAVDGDGDTLSYGLGGTDAGSFDINSSTGVVTFKVAPDYESKSSYSLSVTASDSNTTATKDISLNVTDILEVPILSDTNGTIDENSAAGTSVATIPILFSGDSAITSITLSGTGSSNFEVSALGAVTVTAGANIDYEIATSYSLTAVAVNATGSSDAVNVSITINNIAEIVPTLTNTTLAIPEDALSGDTVGNLTIANIGDTPIITVTLSGTGSGNFSVDLSGKITVSTSASFNYEATTSYTLSAVATNSAGSSTSVTVLIYVNDIPDVLATLTAFTGSVDENSILGTSVGTITLVDGDTDTSAIILSGTGSENFQVTAAGDITVNNNADLDYETTPSYTLSAIARNVAGDSASVVVTINLNNLPEIATLANSTGSIIENALASSSVGTVTIVDGGDSAITAITLSGTGNEIFAVDTSGNITLEVNSTLDYERTKIYTLSAVATNTAGDSASVDVNITVTDYQFNPVAVAKIQASDAETEDFFGTSVSVSGKYIVVGAKQESAGGIVYSGSAYLYKKEDNGTVHQIAKLQASDREAYDYFGGSVSISGDYIVVGAYKGNAPVGTDQGKAYLYKRNSDTLNDVTQIATIVASDAEDNDYFGYSVSISGDYIVIGAYEEDSATLGGGSAYIFKRNSDTIDDITQIAKITAQTPTDGSSFGYSVSISGDYIAVGANLETSGLMSNAGAAYIFKRNSDVSVTQIAKIEPATPTAESNFGYSVSISGDLIAVGAYNETNATESYAGSAYVFKRDSDVSVTQLEKIIAYDAQASAYFGYSISISGNYLIVGSNQMGLNNIGSAYTYEVNATVPSVTFITKIDASDGEADDFYGNSVSIDLNNIAIGAFNEDTTAVNAGSVYIFDGEPLGATP